MVDDSNVPTDPVALEATVADDDEIGTARTHAPVSQPSAGTLPARYRLAGSLGAGGMGEVLLARDTQIDREVAIKRMLIEPSDAARERFLREAKVQGRLDHPAIVPVYELAHDTDGRPFFVMKRLTGTTLADVIAKRDPRYPRQKLLRAFADACLAVELAHSRDVIHRDLKPANIMLGDFGEVYVLDWGIARVGGETDPGDAQPTTTAERQLTQVGAILGTPGYIAPELVRGEPIDRSADVFGLGCILFEILAHEPLLRGGLTAALGEYDGSPSHRAPDRDIPLELDAACAAATDPDRTKRPSARALAEMIERYLDGDRDLAQRKRVAATHLEAARGALAGEVTIEQRALAMREAGRALALDPTSGAADLLGRLMLEPAGMVPEVEARMLEFDDATGRAKGRFFLPFYMFGLVLTPLLIWIGLRDTHAIVAYAAAVSFNVVLTARFILSERRTTANDLYGAAFANATLIAAFSWAFGSMLIAPMIALISMMMFTSDRRLNFGLMVVFTVVPLLAPLVYETVAHHLRVADHDLVIHAPFDFAMPIAPITFAVYAAFTTIVAGLATRRIAQSEREALRKVELQAWHLRQLVHG